MRIYTPSGSPPIQEGVLFPKVEYGLGDELNEQGFGLVLRRASSSRCGMEMTYGWIEEWLYACFLHLMIQIFGILREASSNLCRYFLNETSYNENMKHLPLKQDLLTPGNKY